MLSTHSARTLIHDGLVYLPVSSSLVEDAAAASKTVIAALLQQQDRSMLVRPGESAADFGLIYRAPNEGKDYKYFFHYAHDVPHMLNAAGVDTTSIDDHLKTLGVLYEHLNLLGLHLTEQLEEAFPGMFMAPLHEQLRHALQNYSPYNTTALRGLWYPASAKQTGAKAHLDRSLLTLHVGDEGGDLLGLSGAGAASGHIISPEKGQVLVFFGVKILYLTEGLIQPLWHCSTVKPETDRTALVQFVHTNLGFPVADAAEAYDAFYQR